MSKIVASPSNGSNEKKVVVNTQAQRRLGVQPENSSPPIAPLNNSPSEILGIPSKDRIENALDAIGIPRIRIKINDWDISMALSELRVINHRLGNTITATKEEAIKRAMSSKARVFQGSGPTYSERVEFHKASCLLVAKEKEAKTLAAQAAAKAKEKLIILSPKRLVKGPVRQPSSPSSPSTSLDKKPIIKKKPVPSMPLDDILALSKLETEGGESFAFDNSRLTKELVGQIINKFAFDVDLTPPKAIIGLFRLFLRGGSNKGTPEGFSVYCSTVVPNSDIPKFVNKGELLAAYKFVMNNP